MARQGRPSRPRRRQVGDAIIAFAQEISALETCVAAAQEEALDAWEEPEPTASGDGDCLATHGLAHSSSAVSAVATQRSPEEEDMAAEAEAAMRAMLQDSVVMQQNVDDFDAVLTAVLDEVRRLRAEASHMKRICAQAVELQEKLSSEAQAQEQLRHERAELAARNAELLAIMDEALDHRGDEEWAAFADSLVAENTMLWRLVQASRSAKLASTLPGQGQVSPLLIRKQRTSLGNRSRGSSGRSSTSTPSHTSTAAGNGNGSAARRSLALAMDSPPGQPALGESGPDDDEVAARDTLELTEARGSELDEVGRPEKKGYSRWDDATPAAGAAEEDDIFALEAVARQADPV